MFTDFRPNYWLAQAMHERKNLQERIHDYEINYFGESEKYKMENKHKILGVSWLIKEDYLWFEFCDLSKEFIENENVTKIIIVKFVASTFHPLGIVAPAVVKIKLLISEICS